MSKNVLFIHHVSCLAGAERYLLSLIEALDPTYKIFFICQEPGPLSEALMVRGVVVEYIPLGAWRKFRYFFANIETVKAVLHFCQTHQIDLICSNNYRVTSYAVWPARILKIPSITIIQDFVSRAKLRKFNTFESDLLICVSNSIAAVLGKWNRPIKTIYNGLDMALLAQSLSTIDVLREQFPQLKNKRVVGMVAHIIPLKGHKDFLKAMHRIAQEFDDVMFVLIGDSPHVEQLSLDDVKVFAAEQGLSDRVVFTGARHDVPDLLKSFDVLVHPSHKEAFGRVIMEGMALGVPVVATRCGGPAEIIEDGTSGILVTVGSDEAIAQAVRMLLKDEDKRKEIGKNGQVRIKQKFNISQTVGQANGVFQEVLVRMNKGIN